MPHKYTFCILKVYTNSTLKPSGLFGVYFLYTLNKMKLKTCFGDLYFLYTMQFLTIQKVYITKLL